jgi:hypothetical protein
MAELYASAKTLTVAQMNAHFRVLTWKPNSVTTLHWLPVLMLLIAS